MTALKVCGMRRPEDLDICRRADYLGFVVRSESPRELELGVARDLMSICDNIRVVVTTERDPGTLQRMVRFLDPDVLQLHVQLDRDQLRAVSDLGIPVWGMMTVRPGAKLERECLDLCSALVLDSPGKRAGGNGEVHDWTLSRALRDAVQPLPVILAGGLRPDNVTKAITTVTPFALDVSSGVEAAPGKDPVKVNEMIDAVKRADLS